MENQVNIEDQIDLEFIQRVINEVTQSCALPFKVPSERIPEYILQAAQYFWQNDNTAVEERYYQIKNSDICRGNQFNKIITLPQRVMGVFGVFKTNNLKFGAMGDFSVERMMLSTYSMFSGVGAVGGGFTGQQGMGAGYNLTDVITSMYEVDTFQQYLNAPLTFNYNQFSKKLVLLGDLGHSDIIIQCMNRLRLQDLYGNYYFFRYVVCLVKRALSTIYGMYEFKLPGGVTINYSNLSDQASEEMQEIKEYIENNNACDYFFMPNNM